MAWCCLEVICSLFPTLFSQTLAAIKMIKDYSIYKEFYFREIDRKHELNRMINLPVLVITALISIHFYLFGQDVSNAILSIGKISSIITLLTLLFAIYFLVKSFSNFIFTHRYKEIADAKKILEYENKVAKANDDINAAEEEFIDYLRDAFAECAAHNFQLNKTRTEDLAKAKQAVFVAIFSTMVFSVAYMITII